MTIGFWLVIPNSCGEYAIGLSSLVIELLSLLNLEPVNGSYIFAKNKRRKKAMKVARKASFMRKCAINLSRSSPVILTCLSIAGVAGTAIMAVHATPKALRLIKFKKDELQTEKLSPVALILTTWKCYIPASLVGLSTIACIIGVGAISKRNQASLASAYAMLRESYGHYRDAAKTVYGGDADKKIRAEMAKDANILDPAWGMQTYSMDMEPESEKVLAYDLVSERYFNTTMAAIINAQYHINRNLQLRGYCSLNEYYEFLGLDGIKTGDEKGWDLTELYTGGEQWLDFDNRKTILEDGLECIVVSTSAPSKFNDELLADLN